MLEVCLEQNLFPTESMSRTFRSNRYRVGKSQHDPPIAIAARDLVVTIAARGGISEMKGTCWQVLHIVNYDVQSRFVNAGYSPSQLFLAMIYLVLRETSVDYLGK